MFISLYSGRVGIKLITCLPFSLYWQHGFRSESEQPDRNRVKLSEEAIVLEFQCWNG